MVEKICESCGMPMRAIEDFGGNNPENRYCRFCTYENGELKDFETKFREMTEFLMTRMNIGKDAAEQTARENMAKMPAWKSYF